MKILFIIPALRKGGQEKAGMLLCNFLKNHHEVLIVCFEEYKDDEYNYESPIIRLPIKNGNSLFKKLYFGIKKIRALKKIKRDNGIKVSIAFGNTAIILGWLSKIGEKRIVSIRQSFSKLVLKRSIAMKIHMYLYVKAIRNADRIVSVSKDINNELKKYFDIENNIYINNGYDFSEIEKMADEKIPLSMNERIWLSHTGRFNESKGHWHIAKIFSEIKRRIPNTGLILIGEVDISSDEGGSIANFTKEYFTKNNISWSTDLSSSTDVIYAGHQKNPFKFIKKSTLFIFPSLWEGFPNALVEAMGCGTPVVAADCPTGPKEILIEGPLGKEYGVLLPAFNDDFNKNDLEISALEKKWAEQIITLLSNKEMLKYYSNMSKIRASHFSVEQMGLRWLNVLSE